MEFETLCLQSSEEAEGFREVDGPEDLHSEHGKGSSCSHIEIDGPLWSGRTQNVGPNHLANSAWILTGIGHISPIAPDSGNFRFARFLLAYNQLPPSYTVATTVLRC